MSDLHPDSAFILAAGMGTRLRPYTDHAPKPLVRVGGKPIIDYALERIEAAGISRIAVNLHYRAEQLEGHLMARSGTRVRTIHEETLLDTGGGIKNALKLLGDKPFFVVSGDSIWTDAPGAVPALERMAAAWDERTMDMLILLQPLDRMVLTEGKGDYDLAADGRAVRSLDKNGAYMWTSVRLCHPRLFNATPDGPFSFLMLLDRAEKQGRLFGLAHEGDWHHISTPADLEQVDRALGGSGLAPGKATA